MTDKYLTWHDITKWLDENPEYYWAYVTHTNEFGVTCDIVCVSNASGDIVAYCPDFLEDPDSGETEEFMGMITKWVDNEDGYRDSVREHLAFCYGSPTFKITRIDIRDHWTQKGYKILLT